MATLNELLELAKPIAGIDPREKYVENGGTRTMPIRQYQMIAARFERRRAAYVDGVLASRDDRANAVRSLSLKLDALERTSDVSLVPAIHYVRNNVVPYLQTQARMSPWVRITIKALNKAFLIFAFMAVFGIPLYFLFSRIYQLIH
jgi:hypothetical protein